MILKLSTVILFIILFDADSIGQLRSPLDSFTNQIFLGILNTQTDSSIRKFYDKYITVLRWNDSTNNNEWVIYPNKHFFDKENKIDAIHTFKFTYHPYIGIPYKEGGIEFVTNEYQTVGSIETVNVWFDFSDVSSFQLFYNDLLSSYKRIGIVKKVVKYKGVLKLLLTDKQNEGILGNIVITSGVNGFGGFPYRISIGLRNHL